MIILKSGTVCDALTIIKNNGFNDLTPETNTATHKFFEKDGIFFRFSGWYNLNNCGHLEDVTLSPVEDITPEKIEKFINGETVGALVFEIIAAISLCIDKLNAESILKLNNKTDWIFHIVTSKDLKKYIHLRKQDNTPEESERRFYKLINDANNTRKRIGAPLIKYNTEKIIFY